MINESNDTYQPTSQEHIKELTTLTKALNHIFNIAEKDENERLSFLENNKNNEIATLMGRVNELAKEKEELLTTLRVIPEFKNAEGFTYFRWPNENPLVVAKSWITRQLETIRTVVKLPDVILSGKPLQTINKFNYYFKDKELTGLLDVRIPKNFKLIKITIEPIKKKEDK